MSVQLPEYMDWPPIRRWAERETGAGREHAVQKNLDLWASMVEEDGVVETRVQGKVGWIELSYPKKGNAFVPPMYGLLHSAIVDHAQNDDVWVIALSGRGKNFSSGGYVGEGAFFAGLDAGEDGIRTEPMRRTFVEMFQAPARALYMSEKPTVAAINGLAAGEAVDLLLSADIRIASEKAEIWFSAAFSGNTGYSGSAYILPKIVGIAAAKHLMFTAARVGASEALKRDLVSEVVPPEDLESATTELCETIANLPPITMRLIKQELNKSYELGSYGTAMDLYAAVETIVQTTDDHMNAEEAIARKGTPNVVGR